LEDDKKHLRIINNSGDHLLCIINDILDISKVESGQVEVEISKFNLFAVLEDIKNMFFHKGNEKGIIFNVNYNTETPKYIFSDSKKLRQVIVNLLGNAFKFTDEGAISLTLFSKKIDENNFSICFQIEDTGIGIKSEEKDKIFDNFYQASNSRAGTGLGLSITRNFIELLGSKISVESELYRGTTFIFTLEVEGIAEQNDKTLEGLEVYTYVNDSERRIKVLIVDDVVENIELLSTLLKNIKADVYTGVNAEEGLNVFDRLDFDIIFMDILLPDLNGKEVIKIIRKNRDRKAPIIIGISASIFKDDMQEVIDAGADDFIPKPIKVEDVYVLLNKHLDLNLRKVDTNTVENPSQQTVDISLISLEDSLKVKLFDAIAQGDFFSIGTLIDEISDDYEDFKKNLKEYLDNFDYVSIKDMVEKAGTK